MSAAASFFWFWYASSVSGSFLLNLSRLFLAAPVAFPPEGGAGLQRPFAACCGDAWKRRQLFAREC